jgi:subtilisin-like proprotein convertase family protein
VTLPVTLFNSGLDGAFGVAGTLRFVDPAQGQVLDPDASWADLASGEMLESSDPHFELAVSESVACGDSLMFEFDMSATNAPIRTERFQIPLGEPARDFSTSVSVTIPPETSGPVTSTRVIDQDKTLSDLDVSIAISHNLVTELIVELTSPEGTTVRLHDRSDPGGSAGLNTRYDLESTPDGPGTLADFVGESILGTWTLSVEDVGPDSTGDGSIEAWTLHTTVSDGFDCLPVACAEPPPTEVVGNLHVDTSINGSQVDLVFSWDPVTAAAGYHVLQSTVPSFDTGVETTGSTAGATGLTVPDGANATPGLIFFQVRAVNTCDVEGP